MSTNKAVQRHTVPAKVPGPQGTQYWIGLLLLFGATALGIMTWRWGGTVEDSLAYFNTARYLRGEIPFSELQAPFPYRIVVPALAAALPGDVRSGFALLNWLFVTAAAFTLALTVWKQGAGRREIVAAGLLLIVAVPTFWYGPYLLTDPGSIFARTVFVFAVVTGQPVLAIGAGLVGTAIREENVLLLMWLIAARRVSLVWGISSLLAAGAWIISVRWFLMAGLPHYAWVPRVAQAVAALKDIRSLATIAGAIGIVVPLFLIGLRKGGNRDLLLLTALMAMPPLYAALCVRVDGRAVWGLYPFMIPVAVAAIGEVLARWEGSRAAAPGRAAATATD